MKNQAEPISIQNFFRRKSLEVLFAGVFSFFYFVVFAYAGVSLLSPGKLSPYLNLTDLGFLLLSLGVYCLVFIPWALRQLNRWEAAPRLGLLRFLFHSSLLFGLICLISWLLKAPFLKPLLKVVMTGALAALALPSASALALSILRTVAASSGHRHSPNAPSSGRTLSHPRLGIQPSSAEEAFLKSSLGLAAQARRLNLRVGVAALLPGPEINLGQMDPSPRDQILFLLEEKNRSYEPWFYLPEKKIFITTLLLVPSDDPKGFIKRVAASVKQNDVWLDGARLHLPFKLRFIHGPWPEKQTGDEMVLRFWLEVIAERIQDQDDEIVTEKLQQF